MKTYKHFSSAFNISCLTFLLININLLYCDGALLVNNSSKLTKLSKRHQMCSIKVCDNNGNILRYPSTVASSSNLHKKQLETTKDEFLDELALIDHSQTFSTTKQVWERKKRLSDLILFLAVTGIPLLFTLAALILMDSPPSPKITGPDWHHSSSKVIREGPDEEPKDLVDASNKVGFTKDILRIASQSLNLASNTVDLFNTLRGVGGSSDGDSGDGGGELGIVSKIGTHPVNEERGSSIRFVSKLLQLSTTTLMFILQILNY